MRILSPCQATALVASPTFCLWELPGCQAQDAVAVPLATSVLGALYLGFGMLYLHGGRVALLGVASLLILLPGGACWCERRWTRWRVGKNRAAARVIV